MQYHGPAVYHGADYAAVQQGYVAAGGMPGQGVPPAPGGVGAGRGQGAAMAQMLDDMAGGNGNIARLGSLLNLDDSEFWKGALVGAAAVLLLTNDTVQDALFKTGAKAKAAVQSGADKLKQTTSETADKS
jgi:hypothetical protein